MAISGGRIAGVGDTVAQRDRILVYTAEAQSRASTTDHDHSLVRTAYTAVMVVAA